MYMYMYDQEPISGAKERPTAQDSVELTTAARLCPYLAHSYITAATEVYNFYRCNCSVDSPTAIYGQWQRGQSSCLGHHCSQLLEAPWHHFTVLMGSWYDLYLDGTTVQGWSYMYISLRLLICLLTLGSQSRWWNTETVSETRVST